jgi:hypothetical protein
MIGFSRWFAATQSERQATNDVRYSIEERYESRAKYIELVKLDTDNLVENGFVLEQDADMVVQNAVDRYDVAVARKSLN